MSYPRYNGSFNDLALLRPGMKMPQVPTDPGPFPQVSTQAPRPDPVPQVPTQAPRPDPVPQVPTQAPRSDPVPQVPTQAPRSVPVPQVSTQDPRPVPVPQVPIQDPRPPQATPLVPVSQVPPIPLTPAAESLSREAFAELFQALPFGSILFPGSKAYSQAIFIGNLLYFDLNPAAVVQALTAEDVRATVLFARKKSVKLSIKSGGHSMGGYCLNNGGIVLDMSSMNNVAISNDNIASIGGGAVWNDVFHKARDKNLRLVAIGGNCPSVGVSAFLLGGGVSPFSRKYGLGTDNLVSMTLVTAEGEIVTLSADEKEHSRKDLFWAVHGGGGGNFGVTVNVRVQLRELVETDGTVVSGNLTWKLDHGQEEEFKAMMEVWNTKRWPQEVMGDALWHYDRDNQLVGKMTIVYNGNWGNCITAIWPLLKFNPQMDLRPMHWTEREAINKKVDVFEQKYHHYASFIFEEGAITRKVTDIITNLMRADIIKDPNVDAAMFWHQIGCATTDLNPEDTAFYWRDGCYVFIVKMQWWGAAVHRGKDIYDFFESCKAQLRPHSLDQTAAYVNYIDPTVTSDWGEVYYGQNFARLRRVKREWDPTGFFNSSPQSIPPQSNGRHRLKLQASDRAPVDDKSWTKYALPTPNLLGRPRTTDEAFATDARIRRTLVGID